jgi:hypothetical protein
MSLFDDFLESTEATADTRSTIDLNKNEQHLDDINKPLKTSKVKKKKKKRKKGIILTEI